MVSALTMTMMCCGLRTVIVQGGEERRMKEYIYQIEDDESDESDVFIGWIRKQGHELIRCKDCKYWETDDDESFCSDWGAYGTGAESYCSFAKRKE